MILSSFGFRRKVDFVLYVCSEIDIFEETHFSILSCLGFIFKGFCSPAYLFLFVLIWWQKNPK